MALLSPVSLPVNTTEREQLVDITSQISQFLTSREYRDGIVHVFVPHTTAGVTINENADPDVRRDILRFLRDRVPLDYGFHHAEGNSDAHIKASLMGSSVSVVVQHGRLVLGTWQSLFFCEFDGPRNRKILVKFIPDPSS